MYLWDLDHGFAGVVLIKKAGDNDKIKGCWDSIHVVEVQVKGPGYGQLHCEIFLVFGTIIGFMGIHVGIYVSIKGIGVAVVFLYLLACVFMNPLHWW